MTHALRRRATLAAVALTLGLGGCSSSPQITPGADATSEACRAAAEHWPATLGGQERREVDAAGAAAWGDPAIIVRCGMRPPAPTTDLCVDVDGVAWVAHELTDGYRLTTYGREPAIEALVPAEYSPGTLLLPGLTDAARQLPTTEHRCYGPGDVAAG